MKKKILSMLLCIMWILSCIPVSAAASCILESGSFSANNTEPSGTVGRLEHSTGGEHRITLKVIAGAANGEVKLEKSRADQDDWVILYINPKPGYLAKISMTYEYNGCGPDLGYAGADEWILIMGDGDVDVDVSFIPIEGINHNVDIQANGHAVIVLNQSSGKAGESILMTVTPDSGYYLSDITVLDHEGNSLNVYKVYQDVVDADNIILEFYMPDQDVYVDFEFSRKPPFHLQYTINGASGYLGSDLVEDEYVSIQVSDWEFYALDVVNVTVRPKFGCKLQEVFFEKYEHLKPTGQNQWALTVGDWNPVLHVRAVPNINPIFVAVDTGLGGTASVNVSQAQEGSTVTLTCVPEKGYRVAQIIGPEVQNMGDGCYTFTMPGAKVQISVLFLREENPFLDVNETHFFHDSVLWAVREGVTDGVTPTSFAPFQHCNRAQAVTFLWRAAGSPEPAGTECLFRDVESGKWYTKAVLWALEQGITNGMGDGTFGIDRPCNRAQMVTFLHRAKGCPASYSAGHPFSDVPSGAWYEDAVLWAVQNGITTGINDTAFAPDGSCMRAMVVTFLHRAEQYGIDMVFDKR